MKRFDVTIEFNVPDDITRNEFEEWLKYKILGWGGCSCNNPLIDKNNNELSSNYSISEW